MRRTLNGLTTNVLGLLVRKGQEVYLLRVQEQTVVHLAEALTRGARH